MLIGESESLYNCKMHDLSSFSQRYHFLNRLLGRSVEASDQTMGHLEEEILRQTRGLEGSLLEAAAQKKADQAPALCPVCKRKLSRVTHGHERSYETRFGTVTIRRLRGWCRRCKCWRFPADHLMGFAETGSCSPGVQEMAALVASKMPVAEASAVLERLTGVKLPRATLDREARRHGKRAQGKRQEMDEQMSRGGAAEQRLLPRGPPRGPVEPFTLVIELDAWNILERDGQAEDKQKDCGLKARSRSRGIGFVEARAFA
jgi:hypothetical protein